ncbi:hypothetical protein [Exiguobacterium sp. AB2]|uniref:hypothetical protein n=1 Tax=Exiguobacterium sp. AB2 TaxID=1484479 RepID=UPI0004A8C44C|nr:hypothetical protein [Exiguobacterium sp. AB2]KDN58480.1 hypothetical protein DI14_04930 [Exiguobacterium sp. AB2]
MLTERQTDILFQTLGYAALASLLLTMLLGQSDYYLVGAAVTLTLATVFAGISYLSTKGEDA